MGGHRSKIWAEGGGVFFVVCVSFRRHDAADGETCFSCMFRLGPGGDLANGLEEV